LELSREIARRFNSRFGETFPEPTACGKTIRVIGLDGKNKMSKSLSNHIGLLETPEAIWEKLAPATTDVQRVKRSDPGRPWLCNIYSFHEFFTSEEQQKECAEDCKTASIGCIDCKRILHKNLCQFLKPIQTRYRELKQQPGIVRDFLNESAHEAREIAKETMDEVRSKMGLRRII
jgi:tryptophanyl-tRNA synthetase